jgi:hypothetical protein
MKNRYYILALAIGLAPGFALAQATPNYGYPDRQQTEQDRGMQRQDRDQQQRTDQDYDRGSRQETGNLDRMLQQRYPNSNIQANYQDNNTVVLTGTAATGRDRKDAIKFVRSQLRGERVVDQIQVTGYGRGAYPNGAYQNGYPTGDRDRDSGYNRQGADRDHANYGQQNDRGQQVDRDQDNRVPQSDVDANRTDRDRTSAKDQDRDNHKDKDKKHNKDKDKKDKNQNKKDKNQNKKDHDQQDQDQQDQDQQPH